MTRIPSGETPSARDGRPIPAALSARARENFLWAGATVVVLCLYLFAFGDKPVALFFHSSGPDLAWLHRVAHEVTVFGNSAWYLIPTPVLYAVLRWGVLPRTSDPARREKIIWLARICLFLFVAVAFSGLLTDLLKIFFGRARPRLLFHHALYSFSFFKFSARMWSFPSGHANTIFALATACYLVAPRGRYLYFPIAVIVAVSRVVVGDHYPSDIIMGAYLGVLTTVYLKFFFLRRGFDIFPAEKVRIRVQEAGKEDEAHYRIE
jgi:membrane-associated phospholipid phosphatase